MKKLRTRVRLTKKDWRVIYDALVDDSSAFTERSGTVLRKIGVDGRAARERGVAPVTKRRTPPAPRF